MSFLSLHKVSYSYPGETACAVKEVTLGFAQGEIAALVGPNGCGKTTLTKLMVGILPPGAGTVFLNGRLLSEYTLAQIGRKIGYLFQNPEQQLFCSTVGEEIAFGLVGNEQREKVDYYLKYFELEPYRRVFPLFLSRGEKQRLVLAAVAAMDPDFIILDEPTTGLDSYRKRLLGEYLKKAAALKKGIVLVSHDRNFVERYAERVLAMDQGRVREKQ